MTPVEADALLGRDRPARDRFGNIIDETDMSASARFRRTFFGRAGAVTYTRKGKGEGGLPANQVQAMSASDANIYQIEKDGTV